MLIRALHPHCKSPKLKRGQREDRGLGFVACCEPLEGTLAKVRTRDPAGEFVVPFLCRWRGGQWVHSSRGTPIAATVTAWRSVASAPISQS